MLEKIFKLSQHGTDVRTELLAGLTTFLTMVYIIFVNPSILGDAGMPRESVFVATCLVAALGTAVILWAGFTAARFITHDAFEGRPTSLTVMNIGHEVVTFVVMALIIGLWPPAGTV